MLSVAGTVTFRVTPQEGSTSRVAPMLRQSTMASGVLAWAMILVTSSGGAQM